MPPLEDVNTGRLLAAIDRSWDMRHHVRQRIQERMPRLQERARENNRLLVELLMRAPARFSTYPQQEKSYAGTC
jgi:hypothetical protein